VFYTGVLTTLCVRLGERWRYQPGGGMLAARSGFPVVPVAHNAGLYWPRQSLIKYPGTIDVVIPVIDPAGKSATEITAIAEDWIEATCERIATSPARA
jgi:1-acyl-sn-glycerol-3-phosphate acyltransferase